MEFVEGILKILSGTTWDWIPVCINHSLKATSITGIFNSKVPEKIIAEKFVHRSSMWGLLKEFVTKIFINDDI